jgi:hypothetical protein
MPMNLYKNPIFWSFLFALITLIIITILLAEFLQPYIFFSLFIAIPIGSISCVIVFLLVCYYLKNNKLLFVLFLEI